jgi:hypothetical protein
MELVNNTDKSRGVQPVMRRLNLGYGGELGLSDKVLTVPNTVKIHSNRQDNSEDTSDKLYEEDLQAQ